MNNLGFNPGFNQNGDMAFQNHASERGPQNQIQTYQNSGYINKRGKKKTVILDIRDGTDISGEGIENGTAVTNLSQGKEFNIALREPLIIDKHSEIYLDNLVTFNCNLSGAHQNSAFCLKINEFNIDTNVASIDDTDENTIFNSIVIPNENNDVGNFFGAVVHKGKKYNYVCDINPCTISSLSGTITNLNGNPAFHGIGATATTHTYALAGITDWSSDGGTPNIALGEPISWINGSSSTNSDVLGEILADSAWDAGTILFSSMIPLTLSEFDGETSITLLIDRASNITYTLTGTSLYLKESNGCRMIAEFTIESFD